MSAPNVVLDLDAIEARASAATPGPWVAHRAIVQLASIGGCLVSCYHTITGRQDAEFIAHAREDVPALVAEVRRLRATLALAEGRTP